MSFADWIKKYRFFLITALAAIIVTSLIPAEGKFRFKYQSGRPWLYETLVAPMDIPILKSDNELRDERNSAASNVLPYYRLDKSVGDKVILSLQENDEFNEDSLSLAEVISVISLIYERGVVSRAEDSAMLKSIMIVGDGNKPAEKAFGEVYTKERAEEYLLSAVPGQFFKIRNVTDFIRPNLIFDSKTTDIAHKDAVSFISPTKGVLYTGQVIVAKGETITADIEQLLNSYKAEYELSMGFSGSILLLKLGHLLVVAGIFLIFFVTVFFLKKDLLVDFRNLSFLFLQLILNVLITVVIRDINPSYLFIVPYAVSALYLTSFFNSKVVLPIYLTFLLPVVFIAQNGYELFFLNAIAGGVIVYTFTYWNRGWLQFLNSLAAFVSLSVVYVAFRLVEEGSFVSVNSTYFFYFLWNSLIMIAAFPLIYIFEKIFGLVSNPRLRDMADTTTPLLQELSEKAPGSFQHSLQVANLAEAASREIGAYSLLARVGALYHDIGKMSNPLFFIENQPLGGTNVHKDYSPEDSAKIIIQHVDEGVATARKARLPQIVIDFILTHHGHSQTLFFYNQFVNKGGDPARKSEFTYNGMLPTYKEQVIVMMADAVEAASRTLNDYSEKSVSELVERVVEARISDNQLAEADISLKDINRVKRVFKQKIMQVYHSRISYPEIRRSKKVQP